MHPILNLPHTITAIITIAVVFVSALIHYEALSRFSRYLANTRSLQRKRVLFLVLGIVFTHIIEIWVFAFGYYFLDHVVEFGQLTQMQSHLITDYVYYSATVFTTLGFGDIIPTGAVRLLTGTEAITGLVLITWSASFTFLEMQRFWQD